MRKTDSPTEPYPIDDLRRDMMVKLSVPHGRALLKRAGNPNSGFYEQWRGELIGYLTSGLNDATIQVPRFDPTRDAPRAGHQG